MSNFSISPETLRAQAQAAQDAGFIQLGENMRRAAELTRVPNERLLRMYELLRPGRSTQAQELSEKYNAPLTSAYVREAIQVYAERKLFR